MKRLYINRQIAAWRCFLAAAMAEYSQAKVWERLGKMKMHYKGSFRPINVDQINVNLDIGAGTIMQVP